MHQKLIQFLKLKSISSDAAYRNECERTADFLVDFLRGEGVGSAMKLEPAGTGLPLVYAEISAAGLGQKFAPDKPTLLFYGHYDVQPAPATGWSTKDPFIPEVIEINGEKCLVCRGIVDDKGQVFLVIEQILEILKSGKQLKYNFKLLIEGEEEIGSPDLSATVEIHKDLLQCDLAFIADTEMLPDQPLILKGLRGLVGFKLQLRNSSRDLHSGVYGGAVIEPAAVLSGLIIKLVNAETGEILIPGLYADLQSLDLLLKGTYQTSREELSNEVSAALTSTKEHTPNIARKLLPALTINGIHCGCELTSPSTIIPGKADLVFTIRLAPGQSPERISEITTAFIKANLPEGLNYILEPLGSYESVLVDTNQPTFERIEADLRPVAKQVWGNNVLYDFSGGSIGVVADLRRVLGVETLLFGFDLPTGNIHGPNENVPIAQYKKSQQFLYSWLS